MITADRLSFPNGFVFVCFLFCIYFVMAGLSALGLHSLIEMKFDLYFRYDRELFCGVLNDDE